MELRTACQGRERRTVGRSGSVYGLLASLPRSSPFAALRPNSQQKALTSTHHPCVGRYSVSAFSSFHVDTAVRDNLFTDEEGQFLLHVVADPTCRMLKNVVIVTRVCVANG